MNSTTPIVPNTSDATEAFRLMALAPNDEKPIVEMNDTTARDMTVIWNSIAATAARWRGEKDLCFPGMPKNRMEFWGAFAQNHEARPLPIVEEFVRESNGEKKVAIDLGCGNSPATELLLKRGWRVIAIDSSRSALEIFKATNKEAIKTGQLKVIEADVTMFTPDEPTDLVVAADILPYIDPTKFRATWKKIHSVFLKENAFLLGTLFRTPTVEGMDPLLNGMKEMGAWFLPDRRMVRPLLIDAGYEIKTCKFRVDAPNIEPIAIQFIAQKKATN